jgi:hypothetical protein
MTGYDLLRAAAIKAAIKSGESVPGAFLVETRGIRWT